MASADIEDQDEDITGHLPVDDQEVYTFTDSTLHESFISRIVGMRRKDTFTDVQLQTSGMKIQCHRLVLSAASPYFFNLFESAKQCGESLNCIELKQIGPEVLKSLVDFLYTARIDISPDNVRALVRACDEFELFPLKAQCDTFISKRLLPANCLGLFAFAKKYYLQQTVDKAKKIFLEKPNLVLSLAIDTEFKSLNEEDMASWLSSNDLQVTDESIVFKLLERWVQVDFEGRIKFVHKLLKHVRLVLCDPAFLIHVIGKNKFMQSEKCKDMIEEAKHSIILRDNNFTKVHPRKYVANEEESQVGESNVTEGHPNTFVANETRSKEQGKSNAPISDDEECSTQLAIVVLGGGTGQEGNSNCWFLKPDINSWKILTNIPEQQANSTYNMAACVVGNNIVVTGGSEEKYFFGQSCAAVWLFDIQARKWRKLPNMHQARSLHDAVCVGQSIYVFGGRDDIPLTSVERLLDVHSVRWRRMAPMEHAASNCKAFHIGRFIYVLSCLNQKMQKYNIEENSWHMMDDIPVWCSGASCTAVTQDIYLVGGISLTKGYCFHTESMTWEELSCNNNIHAYPMAIENNGLIWLGGGWKNWDNDECSSEIEEFDPIKNEWKESQITLPMDFGSFCVVKAPCISTEKD